jgi:hypothetical protein
MVKLEMTNNNIEGLPPLPDGYDGYRYGAPKQGEFFRHDETWIFAELSMMGEYLIATRAPLWYPESWRDDMDNVFELRVGEWPPCAPGDRIQTLDKAERERKSCVLAADRAGEFILIHAVAIRIIERAKP